jgi:hypothetical protein
VPAREQRLALAQRSFFDLWLRRRMRCARHPLLLQGRYQPLSRSANRRRAPLG